jgi:hypothetical protein
MMAPADPNSGKHRPVMLEAIEAAVKDLLNNETTMSVHALRVVPKII